MGDDVIRHEQPTGDELWEDHLEIDEVLRTVRVEEDEIEWTRELGQRFCGVSFFEIYVLGQTRLGEIGPREGDFVRIVLERDDPARGLPCGVGQPNR